MKKQPKPLTTKLPKGAYRLPTGGYVTESHGHNITVRAVHKDPPDIEKIARALIQLADDQTRKEQLAAGDAGERHSRPC